MTRASNGNKHHHHPPQIHLHHGGIVGWSSSSESKAMGARQSSRMQFSLLLWLPWIGIQVGLDGGMDADLVSGGADEEAVAVLHWKRGVLKLPWAEKGLRLGYDGMVWYSVWNSGYYEDQLQPENSSTATASAEVTCVEEAKEWHQPWREVEDANWAEPTVASSSTERSPSSNDHFNVVISVAIVSVAHHPLQGPQGRIPRINPFLVFCRYYNLHDSQQGMFYTSMISLLCWLPS